MGNDIIVEKMKYKQMRNTYIGGTSVEPRRSVWLGYLVKKKQEEEKEV